MKNHSQKHAAFFNPAEFNSEKLLMEKMGLSYREIKEVYLKYGVPASRLLELMQLSKYQFIYTGKIEGQCEACMMTSKLHPAHY